MEGTGASLSRSKVQAGRTVGQTVDYYNVVRGFFDFLSWKPVLETIDHFNIMSVNFHLLVNFLNALRSQPIASVHAFLSTAVRDNST